MIVCADGLEVYPAVAPVKVCAAVGLIERLATAAAGVTVKLTPNVREVSPVPLTVTVAV
jgi:hypothetical protein